MPRPNRAAEADDPAVPRSYSQSCRACGAIIAFDAIPDDGVLPCVCGVVNLPAEAPTSGVEEEV